MSGINIALITAIGLLIYLPNKPERTDIKAQSQADIAENFTQIKTLVDINHETFGAANQGKHLQTTFPVRAADPATAVNEIALYCKDDAGGAASLFFKPENQGIGATEYNFTTKLAAENGFSRLPSGILLKWGSSLAAGATVVTFPVGANIPAFTAIYQVIISPKQDAVGGNDYYAFLTAKTTTTITVFGTLRTLNNPRNGHFDYLAIGV